MEKTIDTTIDEYGDITTNCTVLPTKGAVVTEVLDFEYFIYLTNGEANPTMDTDADADVDDVQKIINSLIMPSLHDYIVDRGMDCRDYRTQHSLVSLTSLVGSNNSAGNDEFAQQQQQEGILLGRDTTVGARCSIDVDNNNNRIPTNATSCYQAWGQIQATMWFSPTRRRRHRRDRQLQQTTNSPTPFGDREAFNGFASLVDNGFESLILTPLSNNHTDTGVNVLKTTFQGFVNVNGFDGTVMEYPHGLGISPTAALMGSSYAAAANDGPINITLGVIVIVAGVMTLSFVVLFGVMRQRRKRRAYLEHAKAVDEELYMDTKDDDAGSNFDVVVDDASLFREDRPLPKEYEVTMENNDHDYRTCANPICNACLQRKDPIFIATGDHDQHDFVRDLHSNTAKHTNYC